MIVIDDVIGSGQTMDARLERLVGDYGIQVAAVMAIADTQELHESGLCGSAYIRKKYQTVVCTLITNADIRAAFPLR